MRYLKPYKLFESVITKSEFPTELDIQELFYDLTDEEPLSKCKLYESGYQFFTTNNISRTIRSQLFSDMSFEENWINKECEDIQDTWKNMFIDLSKPLSDNMIKISSNYHNDVYFSEVEEWKITRRSSVGKSYFEKLQENILNDIIPAYPIIYLNLGIFKPESLPIFIECLQRLYEVTGFRPTSSIWGEDYIDEDTGNIVSTVRNDLRLYKVSDVEYKNLCKIFKSGNYTPEITKHFL
jgi:hypothetical protein